MRHYLIIGFAALAMSSSSLASDSASSFLTENDSSWVHWIFDLFKADEAKPAGKALSAYIQPTSTNGGLSTRASDNWADLGNLARSTTANQK
jgi:hypothetical protein